MAVLDTTVLIDLGNPRRSAHDRARQAVHAALVRGETLYTTRANLLELSVGIHRSDRPEAERVRVERVREVLLVLEVDDLATERFGAVMSHLMKSGTVIGDFDTLVAAIALAHGQAVITRNPKHFALVPGLVVESY